MLKIGNVSFLNSFPFQYGLTRTKNFQIEMLVPSEIAKALENDTIDVGLVPVASYIKHPNWQLVSDFCIGAVGEVKTVILVSKKPVLEIETIGYDVDSRSSNLLFRVLAAHYWKIKPREVAENADACVMIGDKTFSNLPKEYRFRYDLSLEWFNFQKLPFAFAVWVSNKKLCSEITDRINETMMFGVNHIEESVIRFSKNLPVTDAEALRYLKENISYPLDSQKKTAIERFAELSFGLDNM